MRGFFSCCLVGIAFSVLTVELTGQAVSDPVAARCATIPSVRPPSDSQRQAAQELAVHAQEAAIVDNTTTALNLYRQAAQLDPTNASVAYALGRAYETTRDVRAITEYCRFLSLSPNTSEIADVRQRIATLSLAFPMRGPTTSGAMAGIQRASRPVIHPGTALTLGLLFPGMGQYYSRRPLFGFVITALTAGAAYYAIQPQTGTVSVTRTATDPLGHSYQYQESVSQTTRPHLKVGVAAAASIAFIGAIEAAAHAQGMR